MKEELIEFIEKYPFNCVRLLKEKYSDLYNNFLLLTGFLDEKYKEPTDKQRIWHFKNNNFNLQYCEECKTNLKLFDGKKYNNSCPSKICKKIVYDRSYNKNKEIIKNNPCDYDVIINLINEKNTITQSTLSKLGYYWFVLEKTDFLLDHYKNLDYSQRIWHFRNNNFNLQYCEECLKNKKIFYKNFYKKFCSDECVINNQKKNFKGLIFDKDKAKNTSLKNFGVDHPMKSEIIKNKVRETLIKNHGDLFVRTDDYKRKAKETNLIKFGVDHYSKSDRFKENKFKDDILKFKENLNTDYELINYEEILKLKHKICGNEFEILRHTYETRKNYWKIEICTVCKPIDFKKSQGEMEVYEYIKSIYNKEILLNDKKLIKPKEIDLILPDLNLCIEYNGLLWHSMEYVNNNIQYHNNKTSLCKSKGYHLIHIWEDHWKQKNDIIKSILNGFISNDHNKIFARKCIIKNVTIEEEKTFLFNNHLKGYVPSTTCIGLYYNEELVQLMSFRNVNNNWELLRLSIKNYNIVIGGSQKLLKYFIDNNNYQSIITYNDDSIFRGDIYSKLGFQFIRKNQPNYFYTDGNKRFNKRMFRNKNGKSEKEIISDLKLLKIYDVGISVFFKNK